MSCGKRLVDDNANKQIELTIQLSNFVPVGAGVGEGSGMEVGMQLSSVKDEICRVCGRMCSSECEGVGVCGSEGVKMCEVCVECMDMQYIVRV